MATRSKAERTQYIIERAETLARFYRGTDTGDVLADLVHEIMVRDVRRDELRTALAPFAAEADRWPEDQFEDGELLTEEWPEGPDNPSLTVGDLRAARAAVKRDEADV